MSKSASRSAAVSARKWAFRVAGCFAAAGALGAEGPAGGTPAPTAPGLAAPGMTLPDGFKVSLFAGEPDVRQPIALSFDPKGRLWVVECFSYPDWEMDGKPGKDRVLILEDTDGDGRFNRRTVFWDEGANLSGIEIGFGGVWLCATPNLIFIPDRDGDDRPDGPPEVVLDGWDKNARHNVFNGLTWGPDGWLWGCNGILSNSRVGPPGTPDERRTPINCGIWRYHPTRKVFETVAQGTTNPWGLDFDDYGEAFLTNCVIPHLFHVTPGAHFQRMFGEDFNPYAYQLIKTCADHVHWDSDSEQWLDIRKTGVTPTTDKLGGGHAHSGAAVYLGDNWPEKYRNTVLMGNIHGNRLNHDRLEPSGSGYVARHLPDFLLGNDPWFRSVAQKVGPDGALYVLDWSDTGECHENDADGAHRENGRVYRVAFGDRRSAPADLSRLDDLGLVELQGHRNDWKVRQARRLLQERAAAGRDVAPAVAQLRKKLGEKLDAPRRLRALWTLHATGGVAGRDLAALLGDDQEHVRAWAVRLLTDDRTVSPDEPTLAALAGLARSDPSPRVRLALASALQRLPLDRRVEIAEGLMAHAEDAEDPNLPLMVWYGVEPLVPLNLDRAAGWAFMARLPTVRRFTARRMVAADEARGLASLTDKLATGGTFFPPRGAAADVVAGMAEALRGRKSVPIPPRWAEARKLHRYTLGVSPNVSAEASRQADRISLVFGDPEALATLRERVSDPSADPEDRRDAVSALTEARVPDMVPALVAGLDDPTIRSSAIRGLVAYDEAAVSDALLGRYADFPDADRSAAVQTLATRPAWALALLEAVGRAAVPRSDISVTVARQIQGHRRKQLDEALARSWGTLRASSDDKTARTAHFKKLLTDGVTGSPEPARGRLVFERTCLPCHKLYGEGGDVGPELTGADRANLDYVLMNVIDPGAAVAAEYRLTNVATADGRLVAGLLREQTPTALVVQTLNGRVIVPRDEVEEIRTTAESMMPEGLLDGLTAEEVRDLVAYLASPRQVDRHSPR